MAAFMIQSTGEEQRGTNNKIWSGWSCCAPPGPPNSLLEAGWGLAQLAYRALCHGPEITDTLAAGPDLPGGSSPSPAHGPRVTALPSLRSLVLVAIPRCPRVPWQERHCLCCGAPQLLICTAPAAPWHIYQCSFILSQQQDVGGTSDLAAADWGWGAWVYELCAHRCCSPKTIWPQELRCLKGIQGSSRNIAKQVCKRQERNELKANFQLLLGYKQGNKTNHVTVQCAFVLNALYQCIRNVYCGVFEMDSLYYTLMNFSAGLVLEAALELERGVGKSKKAWGKREKQLGNGWGDIFPKRLFNKLRKTEQ